MRVLFLLALAVAIAVTTVYAVDIVNYAKCTDTIFCRPETCQRADVPSQVCIGTGNKSTDPHQILVCDPTEKVLGILSSYSDDHCTVPLATMSFVSGECDRRTHQSIIATAKNGLEMLEVAQCKGDSSNPCAQCDGKMMLPKGKCFPSTDKKTGKQIFQQYDGPVIGTTVKQFVFPYSSTCQGNPSDMHVLPAGYCIDGTTLSCSYDNSTRKL